MAMSQNWGTGQWIHKWLVSGQLGQLVIFQDLEIFIFFRDSIFEQSRTMLYTHSQGEAAKR